MECSRQFLPFFLLLLCQKLVKCQLDFGGNGTGDADFSKTSYLSGDDSSFDVDLESNDNIIGVSGDADLSSNLGLGGGGSGGLDKEESRRNTSWGESDMNLGRSKGKAKRRQMWQSRFSSQATRMRANGTYRGRKVKVISKNLGWEQKQIREPTSQIEKPLLKQRWNSPATSQRATKSVGLYSVGITPKIQKLQNQSNQTQQKESRFHSTRFQTSAKNANPKQNRLNLGLKSPLT